jgi:hypothetical protein
VRARVEFKPQTTKALSIQGSTVARKAHLHNFNIGLRSMVFLRVILYFCTCSTSTPAPSRPYALWLTTDTVFEFERTEWIRYITYYEIK